jgi:hypothetical protein
MSSPSIIVLVELTTKKEDIDYDARVHIHTHILSKHIFFRFCFGEKSFLDTNNVMITLLWMILNLTRINSFSAFTHKIGQIKYE